MNARAAFSRGEKARERGDLQTALREYRSAVDADPRKPAYQDALREAQNEAAHEHVARARQAEAALHFAAAVEHWDRALEIVPNSDELKARRALAVVRTQQGDPVVFYNAAKQLVAAIPNDAGARATLAEAKQAALGYHLRLAKMYAEAKSWGRAHEEYEVARQIDPNHRAFTSGLFTRTRARHLEAEGDAALAEGNALAAYQAYEQASRLSRSRRIVRKMKRAKRGAGSMLEQLQMAERYAQQGKWEDAAELYTLMAAKRTASVEVQDQARRAREKSAQMRSDRAAKYAERGFAKKATVELTLALEHTDATAVVMDLLTAAVDELSQGAPGSAKDKIEQAKMQAMHLPIVKAAESVTFAVARITYDDARRQAHSRPAEALVSLRRLAPFAERLPGYERARQGLVKRAFGALLEQADMNARAGRYDQATEQLATALEIAKPPQKLGRLLADATAELEKKNFGLARNHYLAAIDTNARSRLAKLGLMVASEARMSELHSEAAEARVVEDSIRAAAAYRSILEINPHDPSALAGIEELKSELIGSALASAREHSSAGRRGAAFIYYRRVLDVDPKHDEAAAAMAKLRPMLAMNEMPSAYVMPAIRGNRLGDACPDVEQRLRDRMVLYLNRSRHLGAKYLAKEGTDEVDAKKRPVPPVKVRSAVESCSPLAQGGNLVVTMQLVLGDRVLAQERVTATFDPTSVPKDELEDGLGSRQVVDALIGSAAKGVSKQLKKQAQALADWRTVEAHARMRADDPEAVAQVYASLVTDESLSDGERRTVQELERFLLNRFR